MSGSPPHQTKLQKGATNMFNYLRDVWSLHLSLSVSVMVGERGTLEVVTPSPGPAPVTSGTSAIATGNFYDVENCSEELLRQQS